MIDTIRELEEFGAEVDVHDPWVDPKEAKAEFGIDMVSSPEEGSYDGILLAVAHKQFRQAGAQNLRKLGRTNHVLYDLKYVLPESESDLRL